MAHILVVDDDPMVCMAIEVYLERHNFKVTVADSGEMGLRALENTAFDLMIVDIFMPHMRGFESIRIFHERAPTIPLIAVCGHAFAEEDTGAPEFLQLATRLGATRCLRKPFKPATLLDLIDECLSQAEPHRRQVAALGAVAEAVTGQQMKLKSAEIVAMSSEARRADQAAGRA